MNTGECVVAAVHLWARVTVWEEVYDDLFVDFIYLFMRVSEDVY